MLYIVYILLALFYYIATSLSKNISNFIAFCKVHAVKHFLKCLNRLMPKA